MSNPFSTRGVLIRSCTQILRRQTFVNLIESRGRPLVKVAERPRFSVLTDWAIRAFIYTDVILTARTTKCEMTVDPAALKALAKKEEAQFRFSEQFSKGCETVRPNRC